MASIGLVVYKLQIKHKGKKGKLINLKHSLIFNSSNLFRRIETIFNSNTNLIKIPPKNEKGFRCVKSEMLNNNHVLCGIMDAGDAGISSTLEDIASSTVTHKRKLNEVELMPHFFLLGYSKNYEAAFVIIQMTSNRGVFSHLKHLIKEEVSIPAEYSLLINPYFTNDTLYSVLTTQAEKVNSVHFIKNEFSSDLANLNNITTNPSAITEVSLYRPNDDLIKEIFGNKYSKLKKGYKVSGGIEFKLRDDYDGMKVNVKINDKDKVFEINQQDFKIREDISDTVTKDANGHPNYNSIKSLALDIYNDLL